MNSSLYLLQMKAKLLNTVSRSQIGYYQNGEWKAKIMFNFKLHTYVNDPVKNVKGWIGIVRVHEAADRACEIFFPSAVLEVYTKMREHIRSNYVGTPVVVPGGPDKKKDWETFIEEYISDLGMKLCVINLFIYRHNFMFVLIIQNLNLQMFSKCILLQDTRPWFQI